MLLGFAGLGFAVPPNETNRSLLTVAKQKHPARPPMTLGDMRHLGVHRLVATCLKGLSQPQLSSCFWVWSCR
jgi:hypothetical protein